MNPKSEYTPTDAASSNPLLLLVFSGLGWLVIAGLLGLVAAVQAHSPDFLSHWRFLTYGRMVSMAETAFVYGWLANAGLGLSLWVLGRLAGEPLRAQDWVLGGASFWNLGVTGALIGIACGDRTGFDLLGLPSYVQLVLFAAYGAIAVSGLLAWSGRLRDVAFASHWYAAAGLFLFPWLLSIAHVMLFASPVRGVLQPIVAGWYAQSAWSLWLAPLFLAVAYYVVPKLTGRTLPSYEFASLGFWTLIFIGGFTGGRQLLGGPVPAWIPSMATVCCALVFFHVFIVTLNLRGVLLAPGVAAKFIGFGLLAYVLVGLGDTLTSFYGVALKTQFTYFAAAQRELALYGVASMVLTGGIYFALPRITGKAWFSGALVRAHLATSVLGVFVVLASLVLASVAQSRDLLDAKVEFTTIVAQTKPWLEGVAVGQAILLLGNLLFLANAYLTACRILNISVPASFAAPAAMEAPAS